TICLKCLEKEPRRRYGTARAVAEELGRFLSREPIEARPISTTARAWRWCRRKPAAAALVATSAALLLFVAIAGPLFGHRQWELRYAEAEARLMAERAHRDEAWARQAAEAARAKEAEARQASDEARGALKEEKGR